MSAINKRFHASGLAEIFVAADIISECSVDKALCGEHFNRSIRCLTLIHSLVNLIVIEGSKCHNEVEDVHYNKALVGQAWGARS